MRILYSYFRLTLFIFGVLAGVQVPHFVNQYGNALESHFIESQRSVAEFQQEADKYFDGDIEQLIAYYQQSDDLVFMEGGDSIEAIYQRYKSLDQALKDFRESPVSAYQQTFLQPLADIRQEVTQSFNYAVQLTPEAIATGLVLGFIFALISEIVLRLLLWPFRSRDRARPPAH